MNENLFLNFRIFLSKYSYEKYETMIVTSNESVASKKFMYELLK